MSLVAVLVVSAAVLLGGALLLHRGMYWGTSLEERTGKMAGDGYLDQTFGRKLVMTRAITISAPPETVWLWVAQAGRGAGWFSYDVLDNGAKISAEHIVSWIPEPALGDATAIGYLRCLEPGEAVVWWLEGLGFAGATARTVFELRVRPSGEHSRLMMRMSIDARGLIAPAALLVAAILDSIMATRQLQGIKRRAERYEDRAENPDVPETGAPDQYQKYEVVYASGETAGVGGAELARRWRKLAVDDGVIEE